MKYLIENCGCDDETKTEIDLTEKELQVLIKFAKENNKNSKYQCQPVIYIYSEYDIEVDEEDGRKWYYAKFENNLVKGE